MIGTAIAGSVVGAVSSRNASRRAARSQREGQASAQAAIDRGTKEARESAIPLFQSAQDNALQGFDAALALQGRTTPEQIRAFQQGNQNAQNTLLAGAPQFQNAILGGNVDLSGLQQQQIQGPSADFFQQQLPEFTSINQALNPTPVTPPQFTGGGFGGIGGFGGSGNFGGFQNNQFPTGFQMPSNLINPGFPQQPQQPTTGAPGGLLGGIF
jgi:hypothetical protein